MVLLPLEDEMALRSDHPAVRPLDIHAVFAERMAAAGIQPHDRIAIAVSGGPDSMALCLLAKQWCQGFRESGVYAEKPTGIVVDHGLRPESAAEALQVQNWVSSLGMECHVLKCEWLNGRPESGHLQEAARNARYSLMEQTCWENGIGGGLLTGHHADDQAELFMMRLARSSGVVGLAGMAFVSHLYSRRPTAKNQTGLLLVRPLLQFCKQDLYAVCKDAGQEWVEDPTNSNPTFARNRIRQALSDPLYEEAGRQLRSLIAACRQTRAVLDKERDALLAKTVTPSKDFAYVAIDVAALASSNASDAVLGRVLVAVLQFVAQREKPPRGKALKMLMDKIRLPPFKEAFTLAGCHVSPAPGSKGSKIMVCMSPESPTPALGSDLIAWEAASSVLTAPEPRGARRVNPFESHEGQPMLDASRSGASVISQGRELGLLTEAVATQIDSLRKEVAETMTKTTEAVKREDPRDAQAVLYGFDSRKQTLPLGHTCYFMSRFLVSWEPKVVTPAPTGIQSSTLSGDPRGRCCLLRDGCSAFVRHYEETDWDHLTQILRTDFKSTSKDRVSSWCVHRFESDLYGRDDEKRLRMQEQLNSMAYKKDTSKKPKAKNVRSSARAEPSYCGGFVASRAQRVLAILKCVPKPVRRGLPVLVNAQGLLLAIPTLGFHRCPWVSASAVVRPRIPLGGGQASWT